MSTVLLEGCYNTVISDLSGGLVWGRPRLGSMGGVKVALGHRGMMVEASRQCLKDRNQWRAQALHSVSPMAVNPTQPFLLRRAFFQTSLLRSGGLSPGEG